MYFLSLDTTDRRAVQAARRIFQLPYYAAEIEQSTDGGKTSICATRLDQPGATLDVTDEPSGAAQRASPDTLASFLVERYRYFAEGPLGIRLVGSVGHDSWALQSANASVNDRRLLTTVGLDENQERPLAHYSQGAMMKTGVPMPLSMAN